MQLTPPDELTERPHERLSRILDRAALSNEDVAVGLGVRKETVSRWRSGKNTPHPRELRAMLELLATRGIVVTEEWIRTGTGPAAESSQAETRAADQPAATGTAKRGAKQGRGTPAVKSTDVRKRA